MNFIANVFPWVGTILTSIYIAPQVFKVIKNKSTKDISYLSWALSATSNIFWILGTIAGIVENGSTSLQVSIIAVNCITLSLALILINLKLIYETKKK